METSPLFEAAISPWIIFAALFYIIRMVIKANKNKQKTAPPVFDSEGNDDRPGKTIEEILKELKGNFEEKQPQVVPVEEVKRVASRKSYQDAEPIAKRSNTQSAKVTREINYNSRSIKERSEHALHSRRKIINNQDGKFDDIDNRLLALDSLTLDVRNTETPSYDIDDMRQAVILGSILTRPEF